MRWQSFTDLETRKRYCAALFFNQENDRMVTRWRPEDGVTEFRQTI